MRKNISEINFSLHSILTDDSLRHKFYEWATGQELDKLVMKFLEDTEYTKLDGSVTFKAKTYFMEI